MDEILANAYIKGASDLLLGKIEGMPKVLPIPENATNGDMIKAMALRDVIFDENFDDEYVVAIYENNKYRIPIPKNWWNAPYKRGEVNEADRRN